MNERTFLARGTVALALILVGVGREPLALGLYPGLRLATSIVLLVAAPSCPAQLWLGWIRVEPALREPRPLPPLTLMPVVTVSLLVAGVLILLA